MGGTSYTGMFVFDLANKERELSAAVKVQL